MNVLIFGFITLAIITIAALVDIPDNYQKDIEDNWAKPELPEPKLDAIKCPGCGTGNVKKTSIDGVVECAYCGRQFTLRY